MDADAEFYLAVNVVLIVALTSTFVIAFFVTSTKSAAYARADRFSQRIRLPFGRPETRDSVAVRMRSATRSSMGAMLVGLGVAACMLPTPLGHSQAFIFVAVFPVLIVVGVVSAWMSVRERIFHPAPDAPRIARPRALGVSDYLDPFRRVLPWVLVSISGACFAALVFTLIRDPGRVDSVPAIGAAVIAVIALAAVVGVLLLERLVLAQPQPAADTLELAWDDAFRATTIGQLRLTVAYAAWLVLSLSLGALWVGSGAAFSGIAWQLPTWGIIALQFVYPNNGRRLPSPLYPDWLRQPVPAGAPA